MVAYSFSVYHLEYFLMIMVRTIGLIAFAPVFGSRTVTRRVKIFLSVSISLIIYLQYPYIPLNYVNFAQYFVLLIKELAVGLSMGFTSTITLSIIGMAGHLIDREIGFSMVSNFDPSMNTQTTITAELYNVLVSVILLCSNLHYVIISALADSFRLIPLGHITFDSGKIYDVTIQYLKDYFIISLRISLPIMISMILLNVVLGIMTKSAPQMHLFSIGIQIKLLLGLTVLFITITFLPNITEFIYKQMQEIVTEMLKTFYQ